MKDMTEFDSLLFKTLSKSSNRVFFYCVSLRDDISKWSESAVEYFGLPGEFIKPSQWVEKIHPNDQSAYVASFQELIRGVTPYHNCEYRVTNSTGEYVWVNCHGYMNYDEKGAPGFFAGFVSNMGVVPKIDVVTGLWTAYGFRGDVMHRLERHQSGAAMQIDISNFKRINSKFGYDFGDMVMYTVGQKVNSVYGKRATYRMEGSQFAILLDGGKNEVLKIHKQLKEKISEINVNGINLHIDFTTAATVFPQDAQFVDQVQSNLSYALATARQTGEEEVVFYTKDLFEKRNRVIRLTEALRRSINNNFEGFKVVMQPIMDERTGTPHSAEVLLRWSSPGFENVGPMDFVPILEETRGIIPVGKWSIDQAFSYVAKWNSENHHNKLRHVNINFSYIQFADETLKGYILEKLDEYGLPHNTLIAELTESCRIEYTDKLADLLQEYRDEGVIVALDDFGTGYASLSVLRDIPTDIVKLDRIMTQSISDKEKHRSRVEFIIAYCNKMDIDVCTEGVETSETRDIVRTAGTKYIQGYYYDKPLEVDEFFEKYID